MDKLNKVRKVLSAQGGAKVPSPSWVTSDYKYIKNNGSLSIYSKDGKEWYKDLINSPTVYYGPLEGFNDVNPQPVSSTNTSQPVPPTNTDSSLNGTKPVTVVPGAAPVGPNSAVEAAASQNQKVGEEVTALQIKEQAVSQVSQLSPPKVEVKDLNVSQDALKEASKGMNQVSDQRNQEYQEKEQEEKEKKEKRDKAIAGAGAVAGAAFKGIGAAFGAQQAATDSNLTKTADTIYDGVTEQVKKMGPVGQIVGEALGNAAIAGDIIQGLGGGTDQMTTTDKWMDSSFFSWNIGMINGFGGKKADTFAADQDVLESVGSSYGGTSAEIMDAASKSGKKYGLFSSGARKRANRAMAAARAKQNIMADISDEATDQRLAVQSMGEQAGLAYSLMTDGGYNQKYTYAAKQGGTLEWNPEITLDWEPQIELNWKLPSFKEGGQISEELEWVPEFQEGGKTRTLEEYPPEYIVFKNSLPDNQKNTPESEYRTYLYWQLWGKPKDFKYTLEHPNEDGEYMYNWDESDKSYHGSSIAWGKDGVGYFIKPKHHSTLKYELDWFNKGIVTEEGGKQRKMTPEERKEWEDFRKRYVLEEDGNFYKYVPIKQSESFKTGGTIKDSLDVPEIEETTQKNVIPEGALHKNKHHMEHAEGLTKKGIPVIDENGEQQAEIELNEIIFTLEVTKKLEEYYKIFYSEDSTNKEKEQAALEAGKLLVYEILENTDDRTGLIESCKQGGSLTLKKSTDNLIEEALEWVPNIIVIEETLKETIEEKPKKENKEKSEKEQMKEAIKEVLIELLTK